ncbi:MAG: SUMF1/EgtB/PvdO family nonheme iron enzyme [Deltaproteobacteria bacterium]|nr:SUMF1/EgtB/PvdO family nonheme iron enzyme [Deltaproteobacteria bacterium]MCB9787529.1 SUMF1/EgtB/PvdO family nonheme iron enzyme [Deltaproteobacteria bacterium]
MNRTAIALALSLGFVACAHGTRSDGGVPRGNDEAPMVRVPEGPFLRGSSAADQDRDFAECVRVEGDDCSRSWFEDEGPQRTVIVDAFWIDAHEVTNAQYDACVLAGACQPVPAERCEMWGEGGWQPAGADWVANRFGGKQQPRVCVTWHEATAYCGWAGKRLPTEAEWEKAARGTDGRRYPWGNAPATCERAQMKEGDREDGCGLAGTVPVGSFPDARSPYGAVDMAGNAHEWVLDVEDAGFYARAPERNPVLDEGAGARIIRGGSWSSTGSWLRTANRGGFTPTDRNVYTGFRCAMPGP